MLRFTLFFYSGLAAAGCLLIALRGGILGDSVFWLGTNPLRSIVLGGIVGLVAVVVSRAAMRVAEWACFVEHEIASLLGRLGTGGALALALASGAAEEVFFRGGLQAWIGWMASAILFGLLHTGPDARFLGWTAFAVVMGFALGGLFLAGGGLLAPVTAHILVNFANLRYLGRERSPGDAVFDPPCWGALVREWGMAPWEGVKDRLDGPRQDRGTLF
ncbi:MAG: CPBP family glutamic-type intramembrane protease [Planctomycetota bacterium]